jgi:opacity protein-like surface antigen
MLEARSIRLLLCAMSMLAMTSAAGAQETDEDLGRRGLSLRAGAAVGFESSGALDQINAVLPAVLNANLPPGLPAGTVVTEARVDVDALIGVSLGVGYRWHPRFATDLAFDWARGDSDLDVTVVAPVQGVSTVQARFGTFTIWTLTGDLKGYLFTGRIQPYGVVGLGVMRQELGDFAGGAADVSRTGFAPRFGGGIDVYLTRAVLLNLDAGYLLGTGDLDGENATTIRLGIGGRF